MPLTNDRTALFVHIPKCAGTSLEIAMSYGRRYPTLGESRTATTPDYDDLFGGGCNIFRYAKSQKTIHTVWLASSCDLQLFGIPLSG